MDKTLDEAAEAYVIDTGDSLIPNQYRSREAFKSGAQWAVAIERLQIGLPDFSLLPKLKYRDALLDRCEKALDKMLLAATWFHDGPCGSSPEKDYLDEARATYAELKARNTT